MSAALGIDIGGSGIKAAPVDLETGQLIEDRKRIATPQPATPEAVADVVGELTEHFAWDGLVGVTFPGIVRRGRISLAANVDESWLGVDADASFTEATGCDVHVLNDADAAGLAEADFGAAKNHDGLVLLLTLGTGIGSALLLDGVLVPNTELGHLQLDGHEHAEKWAAARVRKAEGLSYDEWGDRVNRYLAHVEMLFSPDLILIGGGISKRFDQFSDRITIATPVEPAQLRNEAGIIGAASHAGRRALVEAAAKAEHE